MVVCLIRKAPFAFRYERRLTVRALIPYFQIQGQKKPTVILRDCRCADLHFGVSNPSTYLPVSRSLCSS
ncbi:hypothetical protein AGR1B_pb0018 [Agrobacterium fabacearum S56]|nr:hypothetical protein AGR1B_pb0018 [Agrobacterium fabacearum S56]